MKVYHKKIEIETEARESFYNVTDEAKRFVLNIGVKNGLLTVYSQHTTCSIIIQEDSHDITDDGEKYLLQDLINGLNKIFPKSTKVGQYLHPGPKCLEYCQKNLQETEKETLNTDAHLRSSLIGRSESIPIINGEVELGNFGLIYFVDFDSVRNRKRIIAFQIIGE
jgi:thiamine phosphate synthase YjbQ (UPF0047 family)